jgi:hypothetical protein
MADFTQTVTNSLQTMGSSEPTLWNAMEWGTDLWGYTDDVWTDLDNDPILNTLTLSDSLFKEFVKAPLTETITFTEDLTSIMRAFGIWDYVFTKPTSDGDEKVFDQFTRVSDPDDDFTQVSDGSTTWTGV